MKREPNTIYVLSLSYGKDSLACLGAIKLLGLPLDRIVHAEVWATDTIPADLPPMVEFKKKADKIIKDRWGIEVEHVCAQKKSDRGALRLTYESMLYDKLKRGKYVGTIKGFPQTIGSWCKKLKYENKSVDIRGYILSTAQEYPFCEGGVQDLWIPNAKGELVQQPPQARSNRYWDSQAGGVNTAQANSRKGLFTSPSARGDINVVQYLGIAVDEPTRIARHENKKGIVLPLVLAGWDEAYCRKWCEENDLLSPIYTTATRGGCWFCHNQSVGQLRLLRKNYPELWSLLLKWDKDSPVLFKADGHTVNDFDKRFQLEDEGKLRIGDKFRWSYLESPPPIQMTIFDYLEEIKN